MRHLHSKTKYDKYKRGLIYYIDFGKISSDSIHEDHLQRKVRPAIIVSNTVNNYHNHTLTVVPLTTKPHKEFSDTNCDVCFKCRTEVRHSTALINQLTTVNKYQCKNSIGTLETNEMKSVEDLIRKSLVI